MPENESPKTNEHKMAHKLGWFLEKNLPIQLFATLTCPYATNHVAFDTLTAEWILSIQKRERQTIAWVRADEVGHRRYSHFLVIAKRPLAADEATLDWQKRAGSRLREAAKIESFRFGEGGAAYVMKSLGYDNEEISFSPNLYFFGTKGIVRSGRLNAAKRRQCRRIDQQGASHP
jgi:hypothetical protein